MAASLARLFVEDLIHYSLFLNCRSAETGGLAPRPTSTQVLGAGKGCGVLPRKVYHHTSHEKKEPHTLQLCAPQPRPHLADAGNMVNGIPASATSA